MNEIITIAKMVRQCFDMHHEELELPFFEDFPKNCCESSSCLFAFYLSLKFIGHDIYVVHGTSKCGQENHIWVEVDKLIFDLTADQFEEVQAPIFGETNSVLLSEFSEQKFYHPAEYFEKFRTKVVEFKAAVEALSFISRFLESNQ